MVVYTARMNIRQKIQLVTPGGDVVVYRADSYRGTSRSLTTDTDFLFLTTVNP